MCAGLFQGTGKWFELQDLHVVEILPQMITLSESYVQVSRLLKSRPSTDTHLREVHIFTAQTVLKSGPNDHSTLINEMLLQTSP